MLNNNRKLTEFREQTRQNLTSEIGLKMRSLRSVEVENAFGDIKGNFGLRRFLLRGLEKLKSNRCLHCIAHNMRKMVIMMV